MLPFSSALTRNAQLQRHCKPSEAEEVGFCYANLSLACRTLIFFKYFFVDWMVKVVVHLFVLYMAGKEYCDSDAFMF